MSKLRTGVAGHGEVTSIHDATVTQRHGEVTSFHDVAGPERHRPGAVSRLCGSCNDPSEPAAGARS